MNFLEPTYILSILLALSVHEWAHGFMAYQLGDPTAKYAGRLTLNPLAHLDMLGTILFVTVGFGWGKPVPVDPRYFQHPKRDTALTALAGPLSNLILACIAFAILVALSHGPVDGFAESLLSQPKSGAVSIQFLRQFAGSSLFLNLGLMAFNLLPIAPLDGSKIIHPFVPLQWDDQYDELMRRGPMILLVLLLAERLVHFPLLSVWIFWIMETVLRAFAAVASVFV
ncbi:MAG: site-2 protease family protein [Candidatus Peregrinibacteria bacterium]|nr:site-2 protease family protein [Candidatus Peregrinibacteria bacterium]